jgi:phage/plasmid-like protein (TIGR03299 family)
MNILETSNRVFNTMKQLDLDWSVEKAPLFTGDNVEAEGYFAVQRSDNRNILGVVTDRYEPYQNDSLVELAYLLSDQHSDLKVTYGGHFNGGRQVYVQLSLPTKSLTLPNTPEDVAFRYITVLNGHDGKHALRFGYTNKLMSCKNMFSSQAKSMQYGICHSRNMDQRVDGILEELRLIRTQEENFYVLANELASNKIRASKSLIDKYAHEVLGQVHGLDEYSTRFTNTLAALKASINTELDAKGKTAWGLFNGVTYYTTHISRLRNKENARLESKMVGSSMKMDNRALELALKL